MKGSRRLERPEPLNIMKIDIIKVKIETCSEGYGSEGGTDGCYLCVFGDEWGCSDCEFCTKCKLTQIQYYELIDN